jgi:sulfopyruvate decarboxylase TPP-binding subunit
MDTTHLGFAVCSYSLRRAGAILLVSVPATIIKSACLGDALNIIPNLSKSYLLTVACIISTAQHANPKVKGQSEPFRDQFIIELALVLI